VRLELEEQRESDLAALWLRVRGGLGV
jgi:hypothetical protein